MCRKAGPLVVAAGHVGIEACLLHEGLDYRSQVTGLVGLFCGGA